ncbi:PREDICTED: uncharacterized protein LOC108768580 isoform X2 [Trachymyrmex cornetzi]|nr:PREDICTED: uncharacterized protein LOC108768580 isoform X2 [Trachymyrmex cornetzi]XP_018374551.1 PREDICTED: uncharacterized protein LOC108768580 isoform X2 [Trachymyrmex cornetzi]
MDAGRSMKSSHLRPDRTFNHHKFCEKPQTGFSPQCEGTDAIRATSQPPARISLETCVNFQDETTNTSNRQDASVKRGGFNRYCAPPTKIIFGLQALSPRTKLDFYDSGIVSGVCTLPICYSFNRKLGQ